MEIQISAQMIRVYDYVKASKRWVTAKEITADTKINTRTVHGHLKKFCDFTVFEVFATYPANRYRIAAEPDFRGEAMIRRINETRAVLNEVAA